MKPMSNNECQKKRMEKKAEQRRLSRKKAKDLMTAAQKEQHKVKRKLQQRLATKKGTSNNFKFCCHQPCIQI